MLRRTLPHPVEGPPSNLLPVTVATRRRAEGRVDDEDLRRRTERVLVDMFLSMRLLHLGLGVTHLVLQRSDYRRRRLAWLGLGVSAGSTALVAARRRRTTEPSGSSDPVATVVDVAAQMLAVRLGGAALGPGLGSGPENIGFLPSMWSAAAISPWSQLPLGIGSTLALATNWAMVGGRLTQRAAWQTAFSALSLYFGVFGVGAFFSRALRSSAEAAMRARDEAMADAEALAVEESRRELRASVHRQTLAVLREIRDTLPVDRAGAQRRARSEAVRLRRLISGESHDGDDTLGGAIAEVVGRASASGLLVDLQIDETVVPAPEVRDVAVRVVEAALDNVARHAGVNTAVVRIVSDGSGTRVTVRDHGVGHVAPAGDWVPPSLAVKSSGLLSVTCSTDLGQGMRIVIEERRR